MDATKALEFQNEFYNNAFYQRATPDLAGVYCRNLIAAVEKMQEKRYLGASQNSLPLFQSSANLDWEINQHLDFLHKLRTTIFSKPFNLDQQTEIIPVDMPSKYFPEGAKTTSPRELIARIQKTHPDLISDLEIKRQKELALATYPVKSIPSASSNGLKSTRTIGQTTAQQVLIDQLQQNTEAVLKENCFTPEQIAQEMAGRYEGSDSQPSYRVRPPPMPKNRTGSQLII